MTGDIRWLTRRMVEVFHAESVHRFGGDPGLRDEGLLESAITRPRNRKAYDDSAGLPVLAAEYCAGIVRNHPFVDGNKRAGLLAAAVFLSLNGYSLVSDEALTVTVIEGIAEGSIEIEALAAWIERSIQPNS